MMMAMRMRMMKRTTAAIAGSAVGSVRVGSLMVQQRRCSSDRKRNQAAIWLQDPALMRRLEDFPEILNYLTLRKKYPNSVYKDEFILDSPYFVDYASPDDLPLEDEVQPMDAFTFEGFKNWFGNDHPVHVDLGCGTGEWIVQRALVEPDINWVGIDLKGKKLIPAYMKILSRELTNLKLIRTQIPYCISSILTNASIDRVFVNWPNVWPKKSAWKHRLVQDELMQALYFKMKPGTTFHHLTDSADLNFYTRDILRDLPHFYRSAIPEPFFSTTFPQGGYAKEAYSSMVGLEHKSVLFYQEWIRQEEVIDETQEQGSIL